MTINACVFTGYGINCERETAQALKLAGARPTIVHLKSLFENNVTLDQYQFLAFPGGFSYGDELGAAKALANRFKGGELLKQFVAKGGLILGVCNGFQLLLKLGLLTDHASLTYNSTGRFEARWVEHSIEPSNCVFTQGMKSLYLPIRHGEGRFVGTGGVPVMRYLNNPNGSFDSIAGITDATGQVLGMMAHPEAAIFTFNHPHRAGRDGLQLFKNGVDYLKRGRK